MMNVLKAAFIITGRANQIISSMMREKPATMPVRHPELLYLILMSYPFLQRPLSLADLKVWMQRSSEPHALRCRNAWMTMSTPPTSPQIAATQIMVSPLPGMP